VYFYSATDDKQYGVDYRVASGEVASCRFTLPFETTFLWYAVADDGKLRNQSNIWIFTTRQIPPTNEKPVAHPGGPYSSFIGDEIDFDGSLSYDPDGNIDFYRWNFGDGSSEILNIQPGHIYYDSGSYTVTLTVVDNDGRSSTKTTSAYVSNISNDNPIPIITATNSTKVDKFTTFSASNSYDLDGSITNYTWDFGDGTMSYGVSTTHTYSAAGAYTVMLTVTDDNGGQDTTYNIITVSAPKTETPGFEFILAILIIGIIVFYKKHRR
jgi:chitodextrinase